MKRSNYKNTCIERQWADEALSLEGLHPSGLEFAVKRLVSGPLLLPRLSCRPSPQCLDQLPARDKPPDQGTDPDSEDGPPAVLVSESPRRLKPSRSLGTLTSCIPRS
ncbi:unnamed protein product [Knipowitschia caucasica]|uniref:Uncharacterized protein n=1 Tax=Knipowitschia caucasica TaxID=637954 RepID=A0AAV2JNL1_KNICA